VSIRNILSTFAAVVLTATIPAHAQYLSDSSSGAIDPEVLAAAAQAGVPASPEAVAVPSLPQTAPSTLPQTAAAGDDPAIPVESKLAPHFDYSTNLKSNVFGANLFTGAFGMESASQFNPEYVINIGDRLRVRLWGAYQFDQILTVDPKGNIFIPNVGPVSVGGTRNEQLQSMVRQAIGRSFRSNVSSYVSLAEAQPVRVFVTGFVNRPGLYSGTSLDSLLRYLDLAGGIDPERGSFLSIEIKRGQTTRATISLYDFLLRGHIPMIQLSDGDVIFVGPRQNIITVTGQAENAKVFEFPLGQVITTADVVALAKPLASATHVRIVHNTGPVKDIEYHALADARLMMIRNGDALEFTADKKLGNITVRVEGEHESAQEYVLPYGARMGDLIKQIKFSERSASDSIQLFRKSVQERQKKMLETSLKSLEASALTARSGTSDEARLRNEEADLILKWIDRAKEVQPSGQVVIADSASRDDLLLENGDVLKVPVRDGLVLVSGEVLFPNAMAYSAGADVEEYIQQAGGYTQNGKSTRIIVAHRNGRFDRVEQDSRQIKAGDEILVLPKIDVKSRQILKEMTQILYQVAVSAGVVLGL
jgi:protein involved in polysaccharide export with SLBB domain